MICLCVVSAGEREREKEREREMLSIIAFLILLHEAVKKKLIELFPFKYMAENSMKI